MLQKLGPIDGQYANLRLTLAEQLGKRGQALGGQDGPMTLRRQLLLMVAQQFRCDPNFGPSSPVDAQCRQTLGLPIVCKGIEKSIRRRMIRLPAIAEHGRCGGK